MYIDSKKFDYSKFSYPDASRLVERDKQFVKEAYQKWVKDSVDEIVDRQWEVDDLGVVEQSGDFAKLLKEAEFTYSLGAYTSTISLVGVCAEDLCRFFANFAGHNLDSLSQFNRVNQLVSLGAITQGVADKFHAIRGLRNDCLHYNEGFKQKDSAALKGDALTALNSLKCVYGEILGVVDYSTVESSKFLEIFSKIADEAASSDPGKLGIEEATVRMRNVFASAFGVDLSMNNSGRPVYKTSIYQVEGIDPDGEPAELSLRDMANGLIVIIDLTAGDLRKIEGEKIDEGSIVAASLTSVPNNLEITASWRLVGDVRKVG
ncbi:DUF4145 domain-containing protein [Aliidiomarina maris]|uniref:Uncharacterized protein DUF4145 n=1 Tax=Aliidiomarina maris TaxID=531312 RepID=A0A327WV26_9GAMM|nr:DUF4145 domain-containing protein [Aliidiomarina maris]RAJ96428.1 uncharacterized protein DUF4145 [Aliidiomarina maris]RUO23818.1 hypothetical protein CWE07_09960 [Aliidiomarina maris]